MKNTKFRKRALLSSVAMLLVALVALGSATFAWYQANLTVSASGMTFSTNAASGLEIVSASSVKSQYASAASDVSSTDTELGHATYGAATTFADRGTPLQPASFDPTVETGTPAKVTGAFRTTTGTSATDGTIKDGAVISDGTANVLSEYVYFKIANAGTTNSGSVALTSVAITPIAAADAEHPTDAETAAIAMSSAIRIVVYKFDGTIAGEYSAAGATGYPYLKSGTPYVEGTGVTYDAKTYNSTYVGTKDITAAASASSVTLGDVTKNALAAQGAKVSVYLDGFDADIISSNAVKVAATTMILNSISLSFTMTPA